MSVIFSAPGRQLAAVTSRFALRVCMARQKLAASKLKKKQHKTTSLNYVQTTDY